MSTKKQIRAAFRKACFERDKYRCRCCNFQSSPERAEEELDAHHITPRDQMPDGGYVPENGITLCKTRLNCHMKAEEYYSSGRALPNYHPDDLYALIASSHDQALKASMKINH